MKQQYLICFQNFIPTVKLLTKMLPVILLPPDVRRHVTNSALSGSKCKSSHPRMERSWGQGHLVNTFNLILPTSHDFPPSYMWTDTAIWNGEFLGFISLLKLTTPNFRIHKLFNKRQSSLSSPAVWTHFCLQLYFNLGCCIFVDGNSPAPAQEYQFLLGTSFCGKFSPRCCLHQKNYQSAMGITLLQRAVT